MSLLTRSKLFWKADRSRYLGYDDDLRTDVIRIAGVSYPLREQVGTSYFVDSVTGADTNTGKSPQVPMATLNAAIGLCTAGKGDRIYVMPKHAETITGAGGITADVAGITIIGLGQGNQRPRFLMDAATTVTFLVSAADVTVRNLVFAAGHADIATCFNVTGVYCWLDGLEFVNNIIDENFVTEIKATGADNTADGLKVTNCRAVTADASAAEFIEVADDINGAVLSGNVVLKDAGTAASFIVCLTGASLFNCEIVGNMLVSGATDGDMMENDQTDNSGIVAHNLIGSHDVAVANPLPIDLTGCRLFQNFNIGVDDASALLRPDADDDV